MSDGVSKEEMLELAQKVEDAVTEYNNKAELVGLEKMTYNNSAHAKYEIVQKSLENQEVVTPVESDDVVVNIEENEEVVSE